MIDDFEQLFAHTACPVRKPFNHFVPTRRISNKFRFNFCRYFAILKMFCNTAKWGDHSFVQNWKLPLAAKFKNDTPYFWVACEVTWGNLYAISLTQSSRFQLTWLNLELTITSWFDWTPLQTINLAFQVALLNHLFAGNPHPPWSSFSLTPFPKVEGLIFISFWG